ncbi:haloacid dehalogenase-like hydrolase domain-containing protein 2 [Cimex lectularius]|uniref:Haloacid dehalogenase-like hydrolase domain-containing protein 2 n=1 Tax=Cimex lectularius TaxID=79782 RepID=A0A8I6S7K4_CIMLE|nr:haloacid dehalogenase-like hydrolase domain-containing protein 2 [Cimex lectularius]
MGCTMAGQKGLDTTQTISRTVRCILVDLSGTVHVDDELTKDALPTLKALRESDCHIRFVTNTTKESKRQLRDRLYRLGFKIHEYEIYSSLVAAVNLIKKENLRPLLLVDNQAMEDFKDVCDFEGHPNAVVIGLAPDKFNRHSLNVAFRLIIEGAKLIAIHEGRFYRSRTGLSLGPGPFVKMLEYATNKPATIVGKPSTEFFKHALGDIPPSQAVMIGDDVRDDIKGAQDLGIRGFLVKTGKYRPGDEHLIENPPYSVVENFAEAVEKVLKSSRI